MIYSYRISTHLWNNFSLDNCMASRPSGSKIFPEQYASTTKFHTGMKCNVCSVFLSLNRCCKSLSSCLSTLGLLRKAVFVKPKGTKTKMKVLCFTFVEIMHRGKILHSVKLDLVIFTYLCQCVVTFHFPQRLYSYFTSFEIIFQWVIKVLTTLPPPLLHPFCFNAGSGSGFVDRLMALSLCEIHSPINLHSGAWLLVQMCLHGFVQKYKSALMPNLWC